jgi:hypothetical protein
MEEKQTLPGQSSSGEDPSRESDSLTVCELQDLEESLLKREESWKVEQRRKNMILETRKNEMRSDWEKREVCDVENGTEQERSVSLCSSLVFSL